MDDPKSKYFLPPALAALRVTPADLSSLEILVFLESPGLLRSSKAGRLVSGCLLEKWLLEMVSGLRLVSEGLSVMLQRLLEPPVFKVETGNEIKYEYQHLHVSVHAKSFSYHDVCIHALPISS